MKTNKFKNKISLLLFLLLPVLILACVFLEHKFFIPKISASPVTKIETPHTNATAVSENPSSSQTNNNTTSKYLANIPILMYHHIRDYNDTSDPIGVNLSVSPTSFSEQLDYILSKGYQTVNFEEIKNNQIPQKPIILTFDDGYQNFYQYAYPEIKKRHMTAVAFIIVKDQGGDYMTADEIKEISDNNIEIGSHTLSHPDLSKINHDAAVTQITESKTNLENLINKKVISFCYPAGKYNEDVVSIIKNAGYDFATTTKGGIGDLSSPYLLSRYRMNHDTNIKSYIK